MSGNSVPFLSHPLRTFDECRELDLLSINRGIPETQLMGQAALASLTHLIETGLADRLLAGGRLMILCGSGNNGGDGLAIAFHLLAHPSFDFPFLAGRLRIFQTAPPKSEAARWYFERLTELQIPITPIASFGKETGDQNDCVVEALLGTGQTGKPKEPFGATLVALAALKRSLPSIRTISIDLPAGVSEEERLSSHDLPFFPDEIHVYGSDKIALHIDPQLANRSTIHLFAIGFYPDPARKPGSFALPRPIKPADLFQKTAEGHKYTAGHGALIAGSTGMEGAALLAGDAFFASGGGILQTIVPDPSSRGILIGKRPATMFSLIEELPVDRKPSAVAIGPGLAQHDIDRHRSLLIRFLHHLGEQTPLPFVILDAAAIDLVQDHDYPAPLKQHTLLTPHSGEWKRIGGTKIDSVRALHTNRPLLRDLGVSVLVKDSVSTLFCATGENETFLRCIPEPSLAVAGSGDVLTGILLAVFARPENGSLTVAERVGAAMELHFQAVRHLIHPTADQFPDAIRNCINTTTQRRTNDEILLENPGRAERIP